MNSERQVKRIESGINFVMTHGITGFMGFGTGFMAASAVVNENVNPGLSYTELFLAGGLGAATLAESYIFGRKANKIRVQRDIVRRRLIEIKNPPVVK